MTRWLVSQFAYHYWQIKLFLYQLADEEELVKQENEMVQAAKRWRW